MHTAVDDSTASGAVIELWRYERLTAAGYVPDTAMRLASLRTVDLHRAVSLATRGCPERTALDILL